MGGRDPHITLVIRSISDLRRSLKMKFAQSIDYGIETIQDVQTVIEALKGNMGDHPDRPIDHLEDANDYLTIARECMIKGNVGSRIIDEILEQAMKHLDSVQSL